MIPAFYIFFIALLVGFLVFIAYKIPSVFLYIFLLGLPFDDITFDYGGLEISVSDGALVLLLLAWLFTLFRKDLPVVKFAPQVYFCLMIMLLVTSATLINSSPPESYTVSFSVAVKFMAFILLLQFIHSEKQFLAALTVLLIGALLSTFLALFQEYSFVTGGFPALHKVFPPTAMAGYNTTLPYSLLRIPAGMNRDAAYGVFLSFPLSLLAGIYLFRFPLKLKMLAIIPLILMLAVLILNDTRSAYIGIILTLFIALFLANTNARYLLVVMSIILPVLALFLYNLILQRRPESFFQRVDILIPVFDYALRHPIGGGVFDFARTSELGLGAHSSFMQILTQGGFIASILYIILLFTIIFRLLGNFHYLRQVKNSASFRYSIYALLTASCFGTLLQSEFIHPRATNKDHWVFLALFLLTPILSASAQTSETESFPPQSPESE